MNYAVKRHRAVTAHIYTVLQVRPTEPVLGSHIFVSLSVVTFVSLFQSDSKKVSLAFTFKDKPSPVVMPFMRYKRATSS